MNGSFLIAIGIVFIVVGLIFCAIAFFLNLPSSVQKASISKPAGIIFYIIGAVTLIIGILDLLFKDSITRTAMQGFALAYLVVITIMFSLFTALVGKKNGKDVSSR